MDMTSGTPRSDELLFRLNDESYHVAQDSRGALQLVVQRITDQDVGPGTQLVMNLSDWSGGAGFSFEGLPGTYENASGWDASTPGKVTTWPRLNTGQTFDSQRDARGWQFVLGGYLYVARGRYVAKYSIDEASGGTLVRHELHDLGNTGQVCGGRPAIFKNQAYVPRRIGSFGPADTFHQLVTVATPPGLDTWATGPATREATAFLTWRNRLVRANGNAISMVSDDPMEVGDWGPEYQVGESTQPITDLGLYGRLLMVGKTDGLYSFDEDTNTVLETPDLIGVYDQSNFLGMAMAQGYLLCPHKSGLIRWRPGAWEYVGPEVEAGMEGERSRGWGRVQSIAPYGRYTFLATTDSFHANSAIVSLQAGGSRQGAALTPHIHALQDNAFWETAIVVSRAAEPAEPRHPDEVADDDAVGTIAWESLDSVRASDDAWATAAPGASHYLVCSQFNFNVPSVATITGIQLLIERSAGPGE